MEIESRHSGLLKAIRSILSEARQKAVNAVNSAMVFAYWEIGKRIVDEEQEGKDRADYGSFLLQQLAENLTVDFGKNFDARELRRIRQFYLTFPIRDTVRPELSWSHYRLIIRIEDDRVRKFYIQESISQGWSTRKLDRNISSQYFQRILSNQKLAAEKSSKDEGNQLDFIKNPYVLEFLKLPSDLAHKEKDIEKAIIQHLQSFLLEMGKGFAFVSRQKLIRTETSDFFIDLVFYNYYLKCFVIVDIKAGKLTHQDIGQLDMYVRMFDDLEKTETDNPTIGILLCADTDNVVAKYSVLNDNTKLFASKYQLYLPTVDELQKLIENDIESLSYNTD
ncbi:PDDEXK nuclease domain-containing protein [Algoriphagus halophytocola]|uniref:PDDEXK nuclease domain-containing protein n=1 Tax=Algoriphagus halophytocola TaxID=2991499 RepID=A0ABY6MCJ1_9BACT|nr:MULTISPECIES: PDDEXK nuclease domain-containing protein [unclassified Algoriphagus]UZD21407.1 PDDEXK nuclease domain-containing protein [Algoriphagus sp. TR-M5]WBL42620.1 PDDEXK nuclease domain-containing protein [Algoriphagus sp. TR-M9]